MRTDTASEKLHLVYATDRGYRFLAMVSAKSAICKASQPERLVVHLLDCGLTDEDWATFSDTLRKGAEAVEVRRHQVSTEQFGGFTAWKGSFAAYARLYVAELLPEERWCLYADCDTLFLDDPLKLLAECDPAVALKGYWIWYDKPCKPWVRDPVESWLAEHCPGMDFSQYLNSGFLLMNLDWWREHRLMERCLDFFRRFPKVPWPDEMALNAVCHGHVAGLPEGWGAFPDYAFSLPRARSIHYVCSVLNAPKFKRFWGYDDATAAWVNFVRAVLGVPVRQACGVPGWKWPWVARTTISSARRSPRCVACPACGGGGGWTMSRRSSRGARTAGRSRRAFGGRADQGSRTMSAPRARRLASTAS